MSNGRRIAELPLIVFEAMPTAQGVAIAEAHGGLLAALGIAQGDGAALMGAIHPDDIQHFVAPAHDGASLVRLATPDSHWRWFSLRPTLGREGVYAGVLVCGERLKSAELSARRYRDYAEISSDWYWEQDAGLRFTYFSREFERISGVPTASGLGRTRWEGLGRERLGNVDWQAHQEELYAHRAFRDFEYPSRRPDGRIVWFRVSGVPRFDEGGDFLGYFGIASDITPTRMLQHDLQQSQRLAAIGQLAAGVAHEINNPLSFARSNLGTLDDYLMTLISLVDQLADPPAGADPAWRERVQALTHAADLEFLRDDARQLLDESRQGLDRVRQIVSDLREFSREGADERIGENIHRCLDSAVNLTLGKLPPGVEIKRHYADLPQISCRPAQLNQLFLALLTNAVQAIGQGPGEISLTTGVSGAALWVDVADTGCGIAAEHLPKIFDPFFTTRRVGEGKGLGLSTAFGIVAEHGGRIDVESTPGAGARFRVSLPLGPAAA